MGIYSLDLEGQTKVKLTVPLNKAFNTCRASVRTVLCHDSHDHALREINSVSRLHMHSCWAIGIIFSTFSLFISTFKQLWGTS